jgi:hypothetical protein
MNCQVSRARPAAVSGVEPVEEPTPPYQRPGSGSTALVEAVRAITGPRP